MLQEDFKQFLSRRLLIEANKDNSAFGSAYETATALQIHKNSGSLTNKSAANLARIKAITQAHKKSLALLSGPQRLKALAAGKSSGNAYLKSLAVNHGVKPSDISEVHHTPNGPGYLVGNNSLNRADNPHDVAVKLKKKFPFGNVHGASLKATEGTASNNGMGAFDKKSAGYGIKTNIQGVFSKAMARSGLAADKPTRKAQVAKNPVLHQKTYIAAQVTTAKHIVKAFNTATPKQKKAHLQDMLRLKPDIAMDKVNGEKGTSTPIENSPHLSAILKAKDIVAKHGTVGKVHFFDHAGKHLAMSDVRTTHSGYTGAQNNYKLGTLKTS